jgi:hypothetical protein
MVGEQDRLSQGAGSFLFPVWFGTKEGPYLAIEIGY